MGIEGKLLVSRKNIVVNKESIGIDNDLTKDRNMNTFKTYCKRRKGGARFPDRKANNRLCACHCIAGNDEYVIQFRCGKRQDTISDKRGIHNTIDAVRSIVQVRWNSWYGHQDVSAYNAIVSW